MGTSLYAAVTVGSSKSPVVWMMPQPWEGNGGCLRELIEKEDQWVETRSKIDGLGYWPWLLNAHFSDDQIRALFSKVKKWNLLLAFEIPVVKGANWGGKEPLDAKTAFDQYQELEKRFKTDGMERVDVFAFDEPIYASRDVIPDQIKQGILPKRDGLPDPSLSGKQRMQYGIKETASFIEMMRKAHPGSRLGDIEPYPALTYDEIVYAIDGIQKECAARGAKGMDFFRLDVDWASMNNTKGGSWPEVKKIEDYCRSKSIAFSLIYWAADYDLLKQKGIDYNLMWYVGVMHNGNAYALVGGSPDEYVLESWLITPAHAVPETDMTTFTRSVLDFCRYFVPKKQARN